MTAATFLKMTLRTTISHLSVITVHIALFVCFVFGRISQVKSMESSQTSEFFMPLICFSLQNLEQYSQIALIWFNPFCSFARPLPTS